MWPGWQAQGGHLGLAVSGGPDSLALLALAQAVLPGRLVVASVDHGLRPESAAEARGVVELAQSLGIPAAVLAVTVGPGNVQAEARAARYAALAEWAAGRCAAVATAHHADDQAETLLMRLNRGAGLAGLAGVRERTALTDGLPVIRPLLAWRKTELEAIVAQLGWTPVRDPGNEDPRFDRARLRGQLAACDWLDAAALAQSAAHLAEVEADVVERCEAERSACVRQSGDVTAYRPHAGRYIRKRVVQGILAAHGAAVGLAQVEALVAVLERGGSANLGGVLVTSDGAAWRFAPEPPRRTGHARL